MQHSIHPEDGLPRPDIDSEAHSRVAAGRLAELIEASGGSLSFAEFMQEALYAPGFGYYSAGATKFGPDGDFVTAPELSRLFGYVIARQAAPILATLGGGDILEPGAGSGSLAVSMLTRLEELDCLPRRYLIFEVSPDLADRQKRRIEVEIPQHLDRVRWIADWPSGFRGVVVANEVLDALPVERFCIDGEQVKQLRVGLDDDGGFGWHAAPAPGNLESAVRRIEADIGRQLEDGYVSEVSLGLSGWIGDLAGAMDEALILLSDYGVSRREYYAADRARGWLRCHFRHRVHDNPLLLPGIQDITSWVDFSAVARAAEPAELRIEGYLSQAYWLLCGGLEEELQAFTELPISEQVRLSRQVKLLTLPAEMGENFKCLALSKGKIDAPDVFGHYDRAQSLQM